MKTFVWTNFGTLESIDNDGRFVTVTNDSGDTRKMSIRAYQESAARVEAKAGLLIGQPISICTAQNSADWSTSVWFSDVTHTGVKKETNVAVAESPMDLARKMVAMQVEFDAKEKDLQMSVAIERKDKEEAQKSAILTDRQNKKLQDKLENEYATAERKAGRLNFAAGDIITPTLHGCAHPAVTLAMNTGIVQTFTSKITLLVIERNRDDNNVYRVQFSNGKIANVAMKKLPDGSLVVTTVMGVEGTPPIAAELEKFKHVQITPQVLQDLADKFSAY